MASFIVNINHNDNLETVIKKCNSNFKAMIAQLKQQAKIAKRDTEVETEGYIAEAIGESAGDLVALIEDEAELRRQGDEGLGDAIEALATVASTGDYDDLINKPTIPTVPTIPIDGAYLTFGTEDPSVEYGGMWSNIGTIAVGSEILNVWKKTA